ncbi:MAG TPA: PASTA domain-containing protein [Acidimicrobiales bacterium]|nr:PASTA domain-containing protein [Acidimicrobiales bacterium]
MPITTDSIGRVLSGRYRIESALGTGASAHVYAAWDVTLQRRVAVKLLHPALATDTAFLRRFRSEAQSAAALAHPHVLAVFDWGEDESGPFLVLEYLGGGSLRDMFDDGRRLSASQVVSIGIQAADGLAYAHGRGFVHRDIKPANLLFDTDGRLRVADFGLARAFAEAALTEPVGATVGTARYAAPEQALGNPVDGRADVYALALVLYEAMTGVVPFTADTTFATLMARVGAALPGHDALGPLAEVLAEAAAPDPDDRLDAAGLAGLLRGLATTLPAPDPFPLALVSRAPRRVDVLEEISARDATQHPPAMAAPMIPLATGSAGRAMRGGEDPDLLELAAAVGVADAASAGTTRAATRRRGRRWPWVTATVVLVVALLAAGGAYAAVRTKAFTPSHAVVSVTGQTVPAATASLARRHLKLAVVRHRYSTTVPAGVVLRMIPAAGTSMKQGTTVGVVVSGGPPPVGVPSLTGVTGDCAAVTSVLAAAGLKTACTHENSVSITSGTVIRWTPQGSATLGSTVSVVVSSGPPIETIPSLTGQTCAGATTTLQALGLQITCTNQYSDTVPNGQVVSWNPTGTAPQGATVAVVVSQGPAPVTVPDVRGMHVADAITTLQNAGLVVGTISGPYGGHVSSTSPANGASVSKGTTVNIVAR